MNFFNSSPDYLTNDYLKFSAFLPILPQKNLRDEKGRFTKNIALPNGNPLPSNIIDPLVGNILGDGHLRFTHKDKNGKPKVGTNALYAMTLKSHDYIMYLWSKIYFQICTSTVPKAWPSPKTGLPATQYYFNSRSLFQLTVLHSLWYVWSDELNKFVKIVPLNIKELLTPIGIAHWIMDDGYRAGNRVILCTDNYTLFEVELLLSVLREKFGLDAKLYNRRQQGKLLCWRIAISGKPENVAKLRSLVLPYFIPSMLYKLGL